MIIKKILFFLVIIPSLFVTKISSAHHFIEGEVPRNLLQGLISGIAHPVIGLDHLFFLIFTSLIVYFIFKKNFFIFLFIFSTILGSFISIFNISFPLLELSIIVSILLVGFSFFIYKSIPSFVILISFIIFGILHGSAYGKTIIDASVQIQISYILGFTLIQFIICLLSFSLVKLFVNTESKENFSRYIIGSLNISAGALMLYIYF
ncbi:MAG: hypothetical protein CFH01_00253 [Alphaproteobacteria bacterium MarineAlpha2_Bin1]|nr:MAG: hypothetical protein CFH01_00253 [Alphaproteobacteria bacterium MarineAlpha2_Bin1]